jgi:gliding motility-associated-like protein
VNTSLLFLTFTMMKKLVKKVLPILFLFVFSLYSTAQNEANVWFFGHYAGIDFNTGTPIPLIGFTETTSAASSICASMGNFLMFSDGRRIWNADRQVMLNGDNLVGHFGSTQGALILQKPGSTNLYYVFTVGFIGAGGLLTYGLHHSIVDITLDNGKGGVTAAKNILLNEAWDAVEKLTAVRHTNGTDIWVITRKCIEDAYAAFLLTPDGINETPVISPASDRPYKYSGGSMKVSYDKKYLLSAFDNHGVSYGHLIEDEFRLEIARFDPSTGHIEDMYYLLSKSFDKDPIRSLEFSPDSKLLYLTLQHDDYDNDGNAYQTFFIYQLDMALVEDSAQFLNSKNLITDQGGSDLQLARDGKIYSSTHSYFTPGAVSVIHKPWKRGIDCDYEADVLEYFPETGAVQNLSNTLLDYLYRFEWEGRCSSEPLYFQSNFIPDPAYIRWSFSDPAAGADSISFDLNPVHYFTQGGEFEVKVVVQYPNGRVEQTSRVVTVIGSPNPDLGPDTLKCEMAEIVLNAGNDEGMFAWSNGIFGNNIRQIIVSDTGWYWVQVTNSEGCRARDSIYVGMYPKAIINEDMLTIFPTGCGASNGRITGLAVSGTEPLSFEWFDGDGNQVGSELDLIGFPVGNYFLHITDGNGCLSISNAYNIEDSGDINITAVETQDAHCHQSIGTINITAVSGDPASLLYSINNGGSWQAGNSLFENLPADNYFVRVKDLSGCESVFDNNPVTIQNLPGPDVTEVTTSPETDYMQNGQIDISAGTNAGSLLHYSIDNGTTFQTDDGQFSNLVSGTYFCQVKDDFGCDTSFTAVVERQILQIIEAIAGNGYTCIGNAAVVPVKLENFKDIFKFQLTITYDTTLLHCDGFINLNPLLGSSLAAGTIAGTNQIVISWQGDAPATLEENATLLELVFGAKEQGLSGIEWAATGGESVFYNEHFDEISARYHVGTLRIYTRPAIIMGSERITCEGDRVIFMPWVVGGTGDISCLWQGPNGFESDESEFEFNPITLSQSGTYVLTVSDTINCVESKNFELIVSPLPIIALADQDTIYAEPGFLLDAGSGYASYLWNTGDTTASIQINQEGLYAVEVASAHNCKSADAVTILWGDGSFYLPNAFTPNGDGLNDVFKPIENYDLVRTYQLTIYSRWGELMFETSDISQGWDGTFKGKPVPGGSYVYRIVFAAYPDYSKQQVVIGNVVVVR